MIDARKLVMLAAAWKQVADAMKAEADEERKRRYLRDETRIGYCDGKASALSHCAERLIALVEEFEAL